MRYRNVFKMTFRKSKQPTVRSANPDCSGVIFQQRRRLCSGVFRLKCSKIFQPVFFIVFEKLNSRTNPNSTVAGGGEAGSLVRKLHDKIKLPLPEHTQLASIHEPNTSPVISYQRPQTAAGQHWRNFSVLYATKHSARPAIEK